jgi:hypothetical protein
MSLGVRDSLINRTAYWTACSSVSGTWTSVCSFFIIEDWKGWSFLSTTNTNTLNPYITSVLNHLHSVGSSVGIITGYGLDDRIMGVRFLARAGDFSLHRVQTDSGAHPASYPMSTGAISLAVKRPGRETDHLPPSKPRSKNARSCTSTPRNTFVEWCLGTGTTLPLLNQLADVQMLRFVG